MATFLEEEHQPLEQRRALIREALRLIPLGLESFADLRAANHTWIDKSRFILVQVQSAGVCDVFLRPRRFGKSLNASMLYYFLSNQVDSIARSAMFEGLSVMSEKKFCDEHMGMYSVVRINFHDCVGSSWSLLRDRLALSFAETLESHTEEVVREVLRNSSVQTGSLPDRVRGLSDFEFSNGLRVLCKSLYRLFSTRVYIIIDEYDTPFSLGMETKKDDDDRATFFALFYSAVRHSQQVKKACFMGTVDIRDHHLCLLKFNYFNIYDILHGGFDDCFGFTGMEVVDLLVQLGLSRTSAEDEWARPNGIQHWYNGYKIGTRDIINPWSFFKYLAMGLQPGPYWINSLDNMCLLSMIRQNQSLKETIIPALKFLLDNSVESKCGCVYVDGMLNSGMDIFTKEPLSPTAPLDSLCSQGYLTTARAPDTDNTRQVWIPNQELRIKWMEILRILSGFENVHAMVQHYTNLIHVLGSFHYSNIFQMLSATFSRQLSHVTPRKHALQLFTAGLTSLADERRRFKILHESRTGAVNLMMSIEEDNKTVIIGVRTIKAITERSGRIPSRRIYKKKYSAQVPPSHETLIVGCSVTPDNEIMMESSARRLRIE